MTCIGHESGVTSFRIPRYCGSTTHLEQGITGIEVLSEETTWKVLTDELCLEIDHAPFQPLEIRYIVPNYHRGNEVGFDALIGVYQPQIRPTHLHVLGVSIFLKPMNLAFEEVVLEWSLEDSQLKKHMISNRGKGFSFTLVADRFYSWVQSVFIAGSYEIFSLDGGENITLAIRGEHRLPTSIIQKTIKQVIDQLKDFWEDTEFSNYSVILNFEDIEAEEEGCMNYHTGTALPLGTTIHCATALNRLELFEILYHQVLHEWMGVKTRTAESEEGEVKYLWFTEGFTGYLTNKLLMLNGVIDPEEHLLAINENLSSQTTAINDTFTKEQYLNDCQVEPLDEPYSRGFIFALLLDSQIQNKSSFAQSIRDLMVHLLRSSDKGSKTLEENIDLFLALAGEYSGIRDVKEQYITHIIKGHPIPATSLGLSGLFDLKKGVLSFSEKLLSHFADNVLSK